MPGSNLVRWLPALAQAGAIFALSSQPDLRIAPDPLLDFLIRKAAHITVFGILAVLLCYAVSDRMGGRRVLVVAFVATCLYAVTDEVHQGFVAGRTTSPLDVIVDSIGAGLGVAGWSARERRRPMHRAD